MHHQDVRQAARICHLFVGLNRVLWHTAGGKRQMQLTVFFADPHWVGVFERRDAGDYRISRVVLGSEPRDTELWELLVDNLRGLKFSDPQPDAPSVVETAKNPKRAQREARATLAQRGVSTKAQEAMRLVQEQKKQTRKEISKAEREAQKERLFALKQEKRKQKKRGH